MLPALSPSFIQQDLRNRSFRRQDLQGAYFDQCDLRGCDFSQANLRAAQFVHCRVGISSKWAIALVLVLVTAAPLFHAVSSLIFASLGTLPGQAASVYVNILVQILLIATVSAAMQTGPWPLARLAQSILAAAVAALMGFFYLGSATGNDLTFAISGAIVGGLMGGGLAWVWRPNWLASVGGGWGAIAAYGLAFWVWANASSLLTTGHWLRGLLLAIGALTSLGVTLQNLAYCRRSLQRFARTTFRQADLTDCRFVETDVTYCDLTAVTR